MNAKKLAKKILPESAILTYHHARALLAAARYGFPSKKMVVIGVTGTKGKTSTANFIWACLQGGGIKTGLLSTANIRIGGREVLNRYHMTMPNASVIQRFLSDMARAGCTHAIVETTSEGIKQYRHAGIAFDVAVFTNLTPEHLPSHGGNFETYKQTKGRLFASLLSSPRKTVNGKPVEKTIIANTDSPHAPYFLNFAADRKITFGLEKACDEQAVDLREGKDGTEFRVGKNVYTLRIPGSFNVYNALPGIILAEREGATPNQIQTGLDHLTLIPGRMETIDGGQNFTILVDYAHEKESMTRVLDAGRSMAAPGSKVIVLLGAEGGGRDKTKRPAMGALAGEKADAVIVSNVDPYEDDPTEIAEDIARAAEQAGKTRDADLFVIEDRREGIRKALSLAGKDDVVLVTGKGAEQSITVGGVTSPWDDRGVVREELRQP